MATIVGPPPALHHAPPADGMVSPPKSDPELIESGGSDSAGFAETEEDINARTVNASNVSNLGIQLASVDDGQPSETSFPPSKEAVLSLRDLFSDPKEEDRKAAAPPANNNDDSVTNNDSSVTTKEELWAYDTTDTSPEVTSLVPTSGGAVTPPLSLHAGAPRNFKESASSLILLSKEGPQRYQAAAPGGSSNNSQANPHQQQQESDQAYTYSSDSSTELHHKGSLGSSFSPRQGPTVLYSAIGSLEDPSNSSFKWKPRNQIQKYELPPGLLLAPLSMIQAKKKTAPPPATAADAPTTAQTGAITTFEPQPKLAAASDRQSDSVAAAADTVSTSSGAKEPTAEKQPKPSPALKKPSNLRNQHHNNNNNDAQGENGRHGGGNKKVQIAPDDIKKKKPQQPKRKAKKPVEMFRPSSDAYTPRMGKREIKYKPAEMRTPVQKMATDMGTLSRPNFRDALRRVAMIIQQHIVKIERRFEAGLGRGGPRSDKLFMPSMKDEFSEDHYITPTYKCTMVRVPMARSGMVYGLKQIRHTYEIPSESEIYEFGHRLFKTVQLSSECSIVCLIYVERLMEEGKVPLLASTWRPIMMSCLLLASKVWQDLSSWNIEFTNVYPQYSLDAIHRLEVKVLRILKWDLYIKSSLYAKYYFALRALVEKQDFRQRYNRMVGGVDNVQVQDALKVEERSSIIKEEALLQLSRSM